MNPQFTREERESLDASTALRRDRQGVAYLPGFVGLNNLKCTDFINVVLQAVAHVRPLRSELLNSEALAGVSMPFVHRLSEVVRKMWSPHNFKNCVRPLWPMSPVSCGHALPSPLTPHPYSLLPAARWAPTSS